MSENQIIVYQPDETVRLDVRLENKTVWLTQRKIAELFGFQKRNAFQNGNSSGRRRAFRCPRPMLRGKLVILVQYYLSI